MKPSALPLVFSVLLLAQTGSSAQDPDSGHPPLDAATHAAIREVRAIREADAVVIGRVLEVGKSPGVWCGPVVTRHEVLYELAVTVAGDVKPPGRFRVGHLLVAGSPLVGEEPRLRSDLFQPGSLFLLCLMRDGESWRVDDEAHGAKRLRGPADRTEELARILREILEAPGLRPYLHPEVPGRDPIHILLNEWIPHPLPKDQLGRAVRFTARDAAGDRPYLEITSLRIGQDSATADIAYPVEGVTGTVTFTRRDGTWHRVSAQFAER